MKITLLEIILYSYGGDTRSINFGDQPFSIITGESKTGKSAIIHIVDYCLGSGECHVPLGVIRQKVAWYAIKLSNGQSEMFIARRNPDQGRQSSTDIDVRFDIGSALPALGELAQNADPSSLRGLLTRLVGLTESEFVPPDDHTRSSLKATFAHARIFCYQDQSLIDNKNQLFFNQQDGFVAQAIRDTLPYFLGAVSETELLDQFELNQLRREYRILQRKLDAATSWEERNLARGSTLLAEARQVGLLRVEARGTSPAHVYEMLRAAAVTSITDEIVEDDGREFDEILTEREALRSEYFRVGQRLEEAGSLSSNRDAYQTELTEQRARLRAVKLLGLSEDADQCPLCDSAISYPSDLMAELHSELEDVGERILSLHENSPRLQEYIKELKIQRKDLQNKIAVNQSQLNAILAQNEAMKFMREQRVQRSRIQGRISSFLESRDQDEDGELLSSLNLLKFRIDKLDDNLSGEGFEDRLRNAESNIADSLTTFSRALELEHSEGRTRLDTRRLTIISDTRHGAIRLENMGSGDNWVGCHVITHVALHKWFREKDRPVPAFLILDQPSKAHYPPNEDHLAPSAVEDDDRKAVLRLFRFLCERASEDGFQIIVVDHADEAEDWFQNAIVERWRGGRKLVPDAWPESGEL